MSWKKADKSNIKALETFLKKNESKCVSFSSRIKSMNALLFFKNNNTVLINENHETHLIDEAILLTRHGLILPILNNNYIFKPDNTVITKILENYKVFSIMGTKRNVNIVQLYYNNKEIKEIVDYHLMIVNLDNFKNNNNNNLDDIKITKAGIKDAGFLFELQKQYEKEEVLLNSENFNKKLCLVNLKTSLKNQVIYYAEDLGKAISKAGTNARGYKTDQIGGVYTDKEYRGRNISLRVLKYLFKHLSMEKKSVCLFVKKSNSAANNLYKKLGFRIIDDYRIVYYKQ